MGDLDDEKRDLFGAVFFFFVSERRSIRVAVTMKQERPKSTIKDNLKVTKKKWHRLWHILLPNASSRPLSRSKVFKYQILKQYTTCNLQNGWRKKIKKKNSGCAMQTSPCFSYFWDSFSSFKRFFFLDQKAECPCLPWTNEKFALKWVCNRIYRSPRCPPQSPFVTRRLLMKTPPHPSVCLHSYFEHWPTTQSWPELQILK